MVTFLILIDSMHFQKIEEKRLSLLLKEEIH